MASFNGADLGFIFSMSTSAAPKALQINAYPGGNGLEVIDMGARGGKSVVSGATVAGNAAALSILEGGFRSAQLNGTVSVLVDTLGATWTNVKLILFLPEGPIRPVAGYGIARKYQAEFLHLL